MTADMDLETTEMLPATEMLEGVTQPAADRKAWCLELDGTAGMPATLWSRLWPGRSYGRLLSL